MLIFTTISVIFWAFIFGKIAKKIKIPNVIALILVGLFFDIPVIHNIFLDGDQVSSFLSNAGNFALIALMFLTGLEISTKELKHEKKESIAISLIAAVTPFLIGFIVFKSIGYSTLTSLIVGVGMCITAEATTGALLLELKKAKTRIGTLMMEAGIIDDILGLGLFIAITFFLKESNLKENILMSGAILAFFTGVLIQIRFHPKHLYLTIFKKGLLLLIIPFFFVSMGIHFDPHSILVNPIILILVIFIAFFGKMFGTFLAKPFTSLSWKKLHLIGWAMNSRGAIELALALIAFRSQLIPSEIYSSLIVMSLISTLIFPFVITVMIKKDPKIME